MDSKQSLGSVEMCWNLLLVSIISLAGDREMWHLPTLIMFQQHFSLGFAFRLEILKDYEDINAPEVNFFK